MHWFKTTVYAVSTILFMGFIGWVITRVMHLDAANHWMGRLIVWDLYAVGVLVAYTGFVGGFHLWEKLTGRMEPTDAKESGS